MVWMDWIKKSTNTRYVNMQLDIGKCNVVMTNFVCHACNTRTLKNEQHQTRGAYNVISRRLKYTDRRAA